MNDKAAEAAYHGTDKDAPLLALEQASQTQGSKGHQIVQQHGLPAPGVSAVKNELQEAEGKAGHEARSQSPADGKQDNGEHGGGQRAAVGQFHQLDVAEYLGQGHHHGTLAQHPDTEMRVGILCGHKRPS